MDLTMFEVHLEDGSFTFNAPFSGDTNAGTPRELPTESADTETKRETGRETGSETEYESDGEADSDEGKRSKRPLVVALIVLVGLAAVAHFLFGDEPEVDVDVS